MVCEPQRMTTVLLQHLCIRAHKEATIYFSGWTPSAFVLGEYDIVIEGRFGPYLLEYTGAPFAAATYRRCMGYPTPSTCYLNIFIFYKTNQG